MSTRFSRSARSRVVSATSNLAIASAAAFAAAAIFSCAAASRFAVSSVDFRRWSISSWTFCCSRSVRRNSSCSRTARRAASSAESIDGRNPLLGNTDEPRFLQKAPAPWLPRKPACFSLAATHFRRRSSSSAPAMSTSAAVAGFPWRRSPSSIRSFSSPSRVDLTRSSVAAKTETISSFWLARSEKPTLAAASATPSGVNPPARSPERAFVRPETAGVVFSPRRTSDCVAICDACWTPRRAGPTPLISAVTARSATPALPIPRISAPVSLTAARAFPRSDVICAESAERRTRREPTMAAGIGQAPFPGSPPNATAIARAAAICCSGFWSSGARPATSSRSGARSGIRSTRERAAACHAVKRASWWRRRRAASRARSATTVSRGVCRQKVSGAIPASAARSRHSATPSPRLRSERRASEGPGSSTPRARAPGRSTGAPHP
ncbi:MAG: hypothetical protein HMLKMBBP_02913 [Planctomycetes bacterium]|nr:hypothetical protein [Planctomycetota bacterium]